VSGRSSARRHRYHPHAGTEYLDEVEYLKADDQEVAVDFAAAVDHAIGRLLEYPDIGTVKLLIAPRPPGL
jgi:plasmid stabilization system protein ParE